MREKAMKHLKMVILFTVIYFIITAIWVAYEILAYGEVRQSYFDSIIAIVLSLSLLTNIYLFRMVRKDKNPTVDKNKSLELILKNIFPS